MRLCRFFCFGTDCTCTVKKKTCQKDVKDKVLVWLCCLLPHKGFRILPEADNRSSGLAPSLRTTATPRCYCVCILSLVSVGVSGWCLCALLSPSTCPKIKTCGRGEAEGSAVLKTVKWGTCLPAGNGRFPKALSFYRPRQQHPPVQAVLAAGTEPPTTPILIVGVTAGVGTVHIVIR